MELRKKLRRRLVIEWAAVAILASLVIALLNHWDSLSNVDNLLYDELGALDRPAVPDDILIVAVDEDSLLAFGKWPWSRDRHAELFEQLAAASPKAIAFDILLSEQGEEEEDSALAAAMARNSNVLLPLHFVVPGRNGLAYDLKEPIAPFKNAATGLGHVNLVFDRDSVVRRVSLCFGTKGSPQFWPHLMEQVYRRVNGRASAAFERQSDCTDAVLLPFSPRGAFSTISYAAIVNGEVPPAFLENKIVLIGATANGLGDQHPVPLGDGGSMAGVEIMANMLGALMRDDFVAPLPYWQKMVLSLVPVWILLAGFWRWRPRTTIFISLALVAAVLISSLVLLSFKIWFAPGAALVGIALVYPVWGWRRLQATSDFMDEELQNFREGKVEIPVATAPLGPVDVVTGQAEQLTHAIAHVRDLRRFISDALSNLPDPMFVTDLQGKVKFANKLAQSGIEDGVQDLALEAMLNRFVASDDQQDVKDYLGLELRPNERDYVEFTSLKGEIFAMRRAPVLSDEGELRGFIHYLADITEVANAAREREEVLQLLSHDMRAPQAAILALLDNQKDTDTNQRIQKHARRTLALADNFVGLARIQSGEFSGEDLLLSELVHEASDSLWPLAHARDIKCVIDDQSQGAFVSGEPSSLHRSFVNLIDNAIKFSPDGGKIDIIIRTISLDKHPHVSVEIADEGEGIGADLKDILFDRFASDDGASKGTVKGAGLGLSFVAAVIERHGGVIRAENGRDGGARFVILLPLAPEPQDG